MAVGRRRGLASAALLDHISPDHETALLILARVEPQTAETRLSPADTALTLLMKAVD